ncbi:MAG: SDR family NAD(P)-dependent oxidoreductase [Clostridia bacterium]|nr:SDR family NAD(P)-dependent oxidoreductase [Clostridia bacterium]
MAKTAIVTGATGGIGIAFVRAIHGLEDVEEIWAVGRSREKLDRLLSESDKVVPIEVDLSLDGITVLSDLLREKTPDIRMLVNNAGIASFGPFAKMSEEQIETFCRINCEVPAKLISIALPYMRRGSGILNVSSASSFQPNPYLCMYSASKVFLKNLSRALGTELKSQGIAVTAVCPGWVDTEMLPREKDGKKIRYFGMISADKVVKKALKDNQRGKDLSAPGFFAKYLRFYSKCTPTKIVMRQWMKIIGKYM